LFPLLLFFFSRRLLPVCIYASGLAAKTQPATPGLTRTAREIKSESLRLKVTRAEFKDQLAAIAPQRRRSRSRNLAVTTYFSGTAQLRMDTSAFKTPRGKLNFYTVKSELADPETAIRCKFVRKEKGFFHGLIVIF